MFLLTQTSEADNRANARGAIENDVTSTLYFDLFNPYHWDTRFSLVVIEFFVETNLLLTRGFIIFTS